jgi:ribose 5-phosphate isomerase B
MHIALAADHGGAALKAELLRTLRSVANEHEFLDLGGDGSDPTDDYPEFSVRAGRAIQEGTADRAILICGSGVGASVAATKMRGVRAAVCHDTYSARQGVEHDDINILCLGARVIGVELALELCRAFLGATFSGAPRHVRRLNEVREIEAGQADHRD